MKPTVAKKAPGPLCVCVLVVCIYLLQIFMTSQVKEYEIEKKKSVKMNSVSSRHSVFFSLSSVGYFFLLSVQQYPYPQ